MPIYKIILLTLFLSLNSFGYWKDSASSELTYYKTFQKCGKSTCYEVLNNESFEDTDLLDVQVPDYDLPKIQTVTKEIACEDEESCGLQTIGFCAEGEQAYWGDRDEDGDLEVWCITKVYPTKTIKKYVLNQARKDARLAEVAAKKALEDSINYSLGEQRCGNRAIALLSALNKSKGISSENLVALNTANDAIIKSLNLGMLDTAVTQIGVIDLSTTPYSEAERIQLVDFITTCKQGI